MHLLRWIPLLVAALMAPANSMAQSAPSDDDLALTNRPAAAAARGVAKPGPVLQLALQTGQSPYEHRLLTEEEAGGLSADYQKAIRLLQSDEAIQDVARRVATVSPNRVSPPLIVFSSTERGAYFNHSFVVLTRDEVGLPPGQRIDSARAAKLRQNALRNTTLHELGHFLQFRLYGGWMPEVDYKSREFSNTDSSGHWFEKEISDKSAWVEGFADALAAFMGGTDRLEDFRTRRTVFYGIREPRSVDRLDRIEAHAAYLLHDFWMPRGQTKLLEHTLQTFRIRDARNARAEHHETFEAYFREHVAEFPEDLPRWELALRANSLLQDSSPHRGISMSAETHAMLEKLGAAIEALGRKYGADRTAQGLASLLCRPDGLPAGTQALISAMSAEVQRLASKGEPVFVVAHSGGAEYETMPLSELTQVVENARRDFEGWFQQYGYDFHPKVREAKERWQKLQAILDRRRAAGR